MVRSIDSVAMRDVAVRILHPEPGAGAGPLERWVDRRAVPDRGASPRRLPARRRCDGVGSSPVRPTIHRSERGSAELVEEARPRPGGVIVLGSGAIPLATIRDRRAFVATAAAATPAALANNRYSADVVSIACVEIAPVAARPARRQRAPALAGGGGRVPGRRPAAPMAARVRRRRATRPAAHGSCGRFAGRGRRHGARARLGAVASVAADRRAELVVAGRTSAATLRWLETAAHARVRALVEERGMRAPASLHRPATSPGPDAARRPCSACSSIVTGPASLGGHLERLGDAAVVDSRVLARAPVRCRRARLAACRGPFRVGPAAARPRRRSVAA